MKCIKKLLMIALCFHGAQLWGVITHCYQTDYMRTLNRTGSVGTVDALYFNPAGVALTKNTSSFGGLGDLFGGSKPKDDLMTQVGFGFMCNWDGLSHTVNRGRSYKEPQDEVIDRLLLSLAMVTYGYLSVDFATAVIIKQGLGTGALFLTLLPIQIARPVAYESFVGKSDVKAINDRGDTLYELSAGLAIGADTFAFSFGLQILINSFSELTQYRGSSQYGAESGYHLRSGAASGFGLMAGFAFRPISWLALSFNAHTGGILLGFDYIMNGRVRTSNPSKLDDKAWNGGFVAKTVPGRLDFGMLIKPSDMIESQLTSQLVYNLFHTAARDSNFFFDPDVSQSVGAGLDFKTPSGFWCIGCGVRYTYNFKSPRSHYNLSQNAYIKDLACLEIGGGMVFDCSKISRGGKGVAIKLGCSWPWYLVDKRPVNNISAHGNHHNGDGESLRVSLSLSL